MDLDDKVFTIRNRKYLVIANIEYNGKQYVYLVNKCDESDAMYREVIEEDNGVFLQVIDKALFRDILFNLFVEKLKK